MPGVSQLSSRGKAEGSRVGKYQRSEILRLRLRMTSVWARVATVLSHHPYFRTNRTSTATAPWPCSRTMIGLISMSDK